MGRKQRGVAGHCSCYKASSSSGVCPRDAGTRAVLEPGQNHLISGPSEPLNEHSDSNKALMKGFVSGLVLV